LFLIKTNFQIFEVKGFPPLARSRVPERLPKKEQKLSEHAKGGRVLLIPAALRNAGHPPQADK